MRIRFAVTLGLVLALAGSVAMARSFKLHDDYGVQQYASWKTSVVSSQPAVGYMTSFSVLAVGGAAEFRVQHATGSGSGFAVNISSVIYLTNGVSYSDTNEGIVWNPMIEITRLDAATTVYTDIGYLAPRTDGGL